MENIKAKFIIEIMGRPPEHIKETLNTLVIRIGSDKGVSLIDKRYGEPTPVKENKNLWTAFAEVDLEFETIGHFFISILSYMPAHVEIYEPSKIKLNMAELNDLSSIIVNKLHNYDAIAKSLLGEKEILINKLEYLRQGGSLEKVFGEQTKEERHGKKKKVEKKEVKEIIKRKKKNTKKKSKK
ncbi:MAG: hypothetical protein Q8P57_04800 [Candidatus Pacearchaeota archaeon]|nr:hypothetical protein [Candidatus Pacearchaeota archaeon]